MPPRATLIVLGVLFGAFACRGAEAPAQTPLATAPPAATSPAASQHPELLKAKVLATFPHDPKAFTQGLVWYAGKLYESTGQYGSSSLREVAPKTGEVLRYLPLEPRYFGEGLALAGDRLIQLTWQEGTAFAYSRDGFAPRGTFGYSGEGWGLCYDGQRLVMSDGSDRLTFRDAQTFAPQGGVNVTLEGKPLLDLNELECVDGAVYANLWRRDEIVRLDPASGRVTAVVAAAGLLADADRPGTDVLNGIAYDPETKTFLITGKLWPKLFEVVFVPR